MPSFQPCLAQAAKCSLTVTVPQVRAVLRVLIIWVQLPTWPASHALAPPVPVVANVVKVYVAPSITAVTPPLEDRPLNESSLMYHSTHGLCVQPYMPIIEYPPAVPAFFSENCA